MRARNSSRCGIRLEGVVSKRRTAPYRSGECRDWRQIKTATWRGRTGSGGAYFEGAVAAWVTWSMWRPTISHVALCGAHVGVPFESGEYLCSGAAIDDPIEGSFRRPDVEPSDELQLVSSSDLLLGTLRRRWTKNCNDLTRLYRRRTEALRQQPSHCGCEAPNTNQQREYRKRCALHGPSRPRAIDNVPDGAGIPEPGAGPSPPAGDAGGVGSGGIGLIRLYR